MYQFNFIKTIMRFSQSHTLKRRVNTTFLKGREVNQGENITILMSLQPSSPNIIRMLPEGDWDSADYIGFQYPQDKLPIKKDELNSSNYGSLKCMEYNNWEEFGVYVTGWTRIGAYENEDTSTPAGG